MEVMIILAVGGLVISCGLEWLRLAFSMARPTPRPALAIAEGPRSIAIGKDAVAAEVCRACRKILGRETSVYRETGFGGSYLCVDCAMHGYGRGIITREREGSVAPAPVQPRQDTFWADVVGIPFELWCSMGSCAEQIGYVFAPGIVAYLAARRDAGDFRDAPVSLVKAPRPAPEGYRFTAPVGQEALTIARARDVAADRFVDKHYAEYQRVLEEHAQTLRTMHGLPDPMLAGPWRGREYAEKVLQAEVIRGQGAFRARFEWLREHIRCDMTTLDMSRWPDKAECPSCDEELVCQVKDGQSITVIKRMVPPNPGLAARR